MNTDFQSYILLATGAKSLVEVEMIQELWSGYGSIKRYGLTGSEIETVIVKHVQMPSEVNHPRGWNSDLSHQRKVHSYQVESAWYDTWQKHCTEACRTPRCYGLKQIGDEVLMALEDLDYAGFEKRKTVVNLQELQACLSWLANFHATFLGVTPSGLWPVGTYWHLATRPEELGALDDISLKNAAHSIDQALALSPFQTFVHGDAKVANFCFSGSGTQVAAVDFQYVGAGCGMKDVAYFIGSCLGEQDCERQEEELLGFYFRELQSALIRLGTSVEWEALEANWRSLYPVAWADFHRFLKGWSPGHWKINSYSERRTREVIQRLAQQ